MNERIVALLYKSISDTELDETEKKELDIWLAQSPYNRSLFDEIMNGEKLEEDVKEMLQYKIKDLPAIIVQLGERKTISIESSKYKWWYAAVAVLFIMLTVGAYYVFIHEVKKELAVRPEENKFKPDVEPGHDGAILKLADGRTIILDSMANGALATEGNTEIEKTSNGQLVYHTGKEQQQLLYNTLSTPRGRKFRLTLPDGSNVWLNAESSITYPSAFAANERKVEITGEAYFEVSHNAARPFKVKINTPLGDGGEVQVLGTHFNIMAYKDEGSINTTLLEGAVKITQGSKYSFLKPGQQAQLSFPGDRQGKINLVNNANLEEAIAWKNGLFIFNGADIKTIMRQVSRWYDVEISYEKEISQTFSGTIPRTVNVSKLFNYLELTKHVHFRIENKKVIVTE